MSWYVKSRVDPQDAQDDDYLVGVELDTYGGFYVRVSPVRADGCLFKIYVRVSPVRAD